MNETIFRIPVYFRTAVVLLIIALLIALLYLGRAVFIPLLLSTLFALLLRPLVVFLNQRLKFPSLLASMTAVLLFVFFILAIVVMVSKQIAALTGDWNLIKQNLSVYFNQVQIWIQEKLNISYRTQENYFENISRESFERNMELIGSTLNSFKDAMIIILLLPIYTFLILLYRRRFVEFLYKLTPVQHYEKLADILLHIKSIIFRYIIGLLIEMSLVCVLTTSGFLIIGTKYALLFGIIIAILNTIPYLGITFAGLITIGITLAESSQVSSVIGVIIVMSIVQLIDNEILIPVIMSNRVKINAMATLIAVFTGGMIAGVAGMFMAIPLLAIIKVIFDRVDVLKAWGYLLGDSSK